MEAADSLFGPGDSSSDPFGSILGSPELAGNAGEQAHTGAPGEAPTQYDGADPFATYGDSSGYDSQTWSGAAQADSGYAPQPSAVATSAGQGQHGQGAYDEYAQWNSYSQTGTDTGSSNGYNTAAYNASYFPDQQSTDASQTTSTSSYDPYAPPTTQPTTSITSPYGNGTTSTSSQSNTYSTYGAYTPQSYSQTSAAPPTPYSPYQPTSSYASPSYEKQVNRPQQQSSYSSYGTPAYGSQIASPAIPPPAPAPARSEASAAAYRPKHPNAYDPPVPVLRSSKKTAHTPAVPPPGLPYSSYGYPSPAPATATPPPPPPLARYTSPAQTSQAPLPPPPARYASPAQAHQPPPPPPARYASPAQSSHPAPTGYGSPAQSAHPPPPRSRSRQSQFSPAPPNPPASSQYPQYSHPPANGHSYDAVYPTFPPPPPSAAATDGLGLSHADPHATSATQSFDPEAFEVGSAAADSPETETNPRVYSAVNGDHGPTAAPDYSALTSAYAADATTAPHANGDVARSKEATADAAEGPVPYGVSPYEHGVDPEGQDPEAFGVDEHDPEAVGIADSETVKHLHHAASPTKPVAPPSASGAIRQSPPSSAYAPNGVSAFRASPGPVERTQSPARSVPSRTASPYDPPFPPARSAYDPPKSEKPISPSTVSSVASPRGSLDAPRRPGSRVGSPAFAAPATTASAYDPYKPGPASTQDAYDPGRYGVQRTASPSSVSTKSQVTNPYAPPSSSSAFSLGRDRAMSGGSVSSMTTSNSFSAYAPNPQPKRQASEASDYGDYQQRYGYSDPDKTATYDNHVQEITLAAPPVYGAYAPSPTLLGANDPLGRTSARAPVISFGAGGRFVTCLHGSGTLNTGFDVALATRQSTDVRIQKLHDVIPQSALDTTEVVFPGPLFNDPGTPTTSLVGTGAAAKTKAKKAKVLQYLEDRANELDRGLGYLSTDSIEHSHAEGKLALVRLLKVMVENDGKLTGSAAIDTAVRAALVPRLANSTGDAADSLHTPALGYAGIPSLHSNEAPLATYQVRASSLDKIQDFLIRGERKKACHYAADEKLWAHAMVIASSVDKDTWKEVVNDFVRSELGVREEKSNGREALRVAYSLFAGQGAAAVEELLPPKLLTRTLGQTLTAGPLQVPPIAHGTPISPNFPHPEKTARVPAESLAKWPETAAMLASSPMTPDSAAALVALGDYLMSNDWIEAAHACYLLSSQAHLIGGSRAPSARIVLVGSQSPHLRLNFHKDSDPVIFSEIAEFAASLTPAPKGQEPFPGWAHLQPYKLVRAYHLAELGHTQAANRYCEAIRNSLTRPSPYLNMAFADELKALHDRLTAVPQLDKAGSWIGGKMAKPSLDSIGNWLEGRFTKFIAGEGENSPPPTDDVAVPGQTSSGPFAHYSAISSAAPSTSPSPQPSFTAYNGMPPPPRSGSAMSSRQSTVPQVQIDRASSAMDHYRRKGSPAPINRVYSANAATTTFAQAEAAGNGYAPGRSSLDESKDNGGWWNSSFTADSAAPTPTATTFGASPENASDEGFISLMDVPASPMPISSPGATRTNYPPEDPDDDDLGLGNASSKRKKNSTDDADADGTTPTATQKKAEPPKPKAEEKKAEPTATSNGWLSRWWKKSDGPAPVKANMGEDNSFYFDKELGKWVNKKAGGAEAAKPAAPPPPPSRAQTASPSKTASVMPHTGTVAGEPPVRATSSFDLTSPPRKPPPPRARSNLVPTENLPDSAPPSPAPGAGLNVPPPPSRPSSRAQAGGKKNLRSRYVDVFQAQPGGGAA